MRAVLDRPCGFTGCDGNVYSGSFCMTHYAHKRIYGEMRPIKKPWLGGRCGEQGCESPHKARGLCRSHYEAARHAGAFPARRCSLDSCNYLSKKRGLCATHYAQARRRGDFGGPTCAVPGCGVFAAQRDLCDRHAKRRSRYGLSLDEMARLERGVPCEVCGLRSEVVDHCHASLFTRGYLCTPCNAAIGLFKDNPALLRAAATYLEGKTFLCP